MIGLRLLILLVFFGTIRPVYAAGIDYKPGFTCPRPNESDPLATAICDSTTMARAELLYEKTYYAQRQQGGEGAYRDLKVRAAMFDKDLRSSCGIPVPGQPGAMPPEAATCYVKKVQAEVLKWNSSLTGGALDEAQRDIDQHIAIQQRLIDDRLLLSKTADGVYGSATRSAIINWQVSKGFAPTGFIATSQVEALMSQPPPAVSIANARGQSSTRVLTKILTPDMLDVEVPFLETITGPAMKVSHLNDRRDARLYLIEDCRLTVYSQGSTVYGYAIAVDPLCKADLSAITNMDFPTVSHATVGELYDTLMFGIEMKATCLKGCGNAVDPRVFWKWTGPHASNWIEVEFDAVLDNAEVLNAADKWTSEMADEPEDYITSGRFNCDEKYSAAAQVAFRSAKVSDIFVGHGNTENDDEIAKDCPQNVSLHSTAARAPSDPPSPVLNSMAASNVVTNTTVRQDNLPSFNNEPVGADLLATNVGHASCQFLASAGARGLMEGMCQPAEFEHTGYLIMIAFFVLLLGGGVFIVL